MKLLSLVAIAISLLAVIPSTARALEASSPKVVSLNAAGEPTRASCRAPQFSPNAKFLTFVCQSEGLGMANEVDNSNTFVVDLSVGTAVRVSVDNDGQAPGVGASGLGVPSNDGNLVVFGSHRQLHPDGSLGGAKFGHSNVFLRDVANATTELVTRTADGSGNPGYGGAYMGDLSHTSHEIVFQSSENYVATPGPVSPFTQKLFLRNWETGHVEGIAVRPDGLPTNAGASSPNMSDDGRYVTFVSNATDITTDNPNAYYLVFIRDRLTQTTTRLSRPWHGGEFVAAPYFVPPKLSSDGRYVLFRAAASPGEITPDDTTPWTDAFVLDRATGQTTMISRGANGEPANQRSEDLAISDDGRIVAFFSYATNLLSTPTTTPGIYVLDRATGEIVNVTSSLGDQGNYRSVVELSRDGRHLAFDWFVTNPALPDLVGRQRVFTVELTGGPLPSAAEIPSASFWSLAMMTLLLMAIAILRLRQRQHRIAR